MKTLSSITSSIALSTQAALIIASLGVTAIGLTKPAIANDSTTFKRVEHQVSVAEQGQFVIHNNVGSLDIRYAEQPYVSVEVTFEGQRSGVFRRTTDVSNMDIEIRQSNDKLELSFDENNVNARWVIVAPAFATTRIHQGVGSLKSQYFSGNTTINLGVGDVEIQLDPALLADFDARVGVGAVSAQGLENTHSNRKIVSETVTASGNGDYQLAIDVGVGDIRVRNSTK